MAAKTKPKPKETGTDLEPTDPAEKLRAFRDKVGDEEYLDLANEGDEEALATITEGLKAMGAKGERIWGAWGNLAGHAETIIREKLTGKLVQEAVKKRLATMREELAGPDPSPLEKLLAEQAALNWLWVHYAELLCAWNVGQPGEEERDRRRDRAQKRYLATLRTLAQVRRLLGPGVQVNVAQQVNVVATGESIVQSKNREEQYGEISNL